LEFEDTQALESLLEPVLGMIKDHANKR